jgi:hypothetical protein
MANRSLKKMGKASTRALNFYHRMNAKTTIPFCKSQNGIVHAGYFIFQTQWLPVLPPATQSAPGRENN